MSPTALPTFDELLLQKPRSVGVVLRCHACNAPVFLRYAARVCQQSRRAVAAGLRRRTADREVRVQLRARGRGDVLPRGADLLLAQSVPGVRVDVPAHRGATFADLGNSTKLRLFDSLSDVREMAEIDEETLRRGHARHLHRQQTDALVDLPFVDAYQAAVLLEVMKDFLYQAYVRKGRLQHAMKVRRFFAEEHAAPSRWPRQLGNGATLPMC